MHKISNKVLLLSIVLLMMFFTACKDEIATVPNKNSDLTMFISSDIHYLDKELYDDGEAFQKYTENSNGRNFLYIDEVVNAFVYEIENKKPDILIISGDLTNNGEKDSHLKLTEKLKKIEDSSDTRVFVIPGNHDIDNPRARGFEGSKQILTDQPEKGFKYDMTSVDVEEWAKVTGQTDENVLNFNEYSKGLYAESAYKKAYDRLSKIESYSEEEKVEMVKTMGIINTARFGGDTESIREEVMNSKGYELWVNASEGSCNECSQRHQ